MYYTRKHNCNKTRTHYRGDKNTQRDKTKKNKSQDKWDTKMTGKTNKNIATI